MCQYLQAMLSTILCYTTPLLFAALQEAQAGGSGLLLRLYCAIIAMVAVGGLAYAYKLPERWAPGCFDLIGMPALPPPDGKHTPRVPYLQVIIGACCLCCALNLRGRRELVSGPPPSPPPRNRRIGKLWCREGGGGVESKEGTFMPEMVPWWHFVFDLPLRFPVPHVQTVHSRLPFAFDLCDCVAGLTRMDRAD